MTAQILTVAELNRTARQLLEQNFPLLWVGGEISNLTRAASGHVYFSLKDDQAQVRCVMFRSRAQLLPWRLSNGDQVEAQALVTLYEARGDFQLNVESLRQAGIGRLYEQFVKLREKLAAEGLFEAARKRPMPRFPRRVGIITSPQAAALRDVVAAFARRAPHVELILYPTPVQGVEAPAALAEALKAAYARAECDLLLIVRGGGSLEDLWAFNDEALARTLAASPLPTIAGIGHETDTTIADYVADRRAATPTAAAELASAGWFDAATEIDALAAALRRTTLATLQARMQALDRLALRLLHPAQRLGTDRQRLDALARRLATAVQRRMADRHARLARFELAFARTRPDTQAARQHLDRLGQYLRQGMEGILMRQRDRLTRCSGALTALSPAATLRRGYGIVRAPNGDIVRDAASLTPGDRLHLQFASGAAEAVVAAVAPQD
ncbi:MAG: exodeoxyribonuclease VII large subunit [Pseudomonadota bacterium]